MSPHLQDPDLQKYLSKLNRQLQVLPQTERQDVLKELESHVYEELQQGKQPLAIIQRLGEPESYARIYLEQYSDQLRSSGKLPEHARFMFRMAFVPVLIAGLIFFGLMQANTLIVWWEIFQNGNPPPLSVVAQLMLLTLPALVVLFIPVCTLFIVPIYVYRIRGADALQTLRSARVWLLTLLVGLLMSGIGLGVQELAVPAANIQTVEVLKDLLKVTSLGKGEPAPEFSPRPDVRSLTLAKAYAYLDGSSTATWRDYRDYYLKISLPLSALAFALYGLLIASLMLSGLFQPLYTLIVIGVIAPLSLFYLSYSLFVDERFSPLLAACLPNLVLTGFSLVFLLGLLLQLPGRVPARGSSLHGAAE